NELKTIHLLFELKNNSYGYVNRDVSINSQNVFKTSFNPHHITYGEYEYYLTSANEEELYIDINNIRELESNLFYVGKLNPVFSVDNIIFAEKGESIFNTKGHHELHPNMYILSSGLLKYNKQISYYERNKETTDSYYSER
ncbi:hypothetical protein, partial [Enterocloster citroniae]